MKTELAEQLAKVLGWPHYYSSLCDRITDYNILLPEVERWLDEKNLVLHSYRMDGIWNVALVPRHWSVKDNMWSRNKDKATAIAMAVIAANAVIAAGEKE